MSQLVRDWGVHRQKRRRPVPRWVWWLAAVAMLAFLGAEAWRALRPHPWRAHFAACSLGEVSGWCSQLAVPEDPRKPSGRTISLRVAVLPATRKPAAGALFYLEGGPGVAATGSAARVNELFAEVGRTRDIVLVDQRGTGGSNRVACPNDRVRATDAPGVSAYLRRCFARLRSDPRLYTTSVAAADLEAVRRALGYRKIDLYGGSYGATLAQAYVQAYPQSVRTVVLDSGTLSSVRIYDLEARNAERALDVDLARCGRACRATRRELTALVARPPHTVTVEAGTATLRAQDVAWTVFLLSETADSATTIPYVVDAAARGQYVPLARAYFAELGPGLAAPQRLAASWEILCSEPWARFDPAATARAGAGSYLAEAAVERARFFQRVCRVVPKGRVLPRRQEPIRAPALLLAGDADPLDPVTNLRGWRRAFPNARLVVVPGAAHGTIEYGCVPFLIARFVARGTAAGLDTSCVRR